MWTCRKCSAEVEDNFEICWSCGTGNDGSQDPNFRSFQSDAEVPAVAASEAEPKSVTVATYWVADQAQKVQSLLENGGVPVCIAYDFDVAHDWVHEHATGSIQLQVTEELVEKARELLARHPKETAPLPPLPPKPPEPDEEEKYKQQPWLAPIPKDLSREEVLRLLEAQVSALIDSKDMPDWKVNPAFHPDVMTFIQKHANNMGFVQKAQALQRNRAKYFATIRQQLLNPKPKEEEEAKEEKTTGPSAWGALGKKLKFWLIVRPLRWGLRLLKWTLALGCVALFLGFCAALIYGGYGSKQLDDAINETDEKDPGWTWNSLQANRKAIPDKENAALVVSEVGRPLSANWPESEGWRALIDEIDRDPQVQLTPEQLALLRAVLEKHQSTLEQARSLATLSVGRWPTLGADELEGGTEPALRVGEPVANLLWLDALLHAQQQQPNQALLSARALLAVGRSVGDDPDQTRQVLRRLCGGLACSAIQRVLAGCGDCTEDSLAATQRLVEQEDREPLLWYVLRGERARHQQLWARVEAGSIFEIHRTTASPDDWALLSHGVPFATVERGLRKGQYKVGQAHYLRQMTELVTIAKLPPEEQTTKFKAMNVPPMLASVIEGCLRNHARLRCTAAALALERYRLAQQQWPASWDQLVPTYLPAKPLDPFDGQPLRLKKSDVGLIVYAVGMDQNDDGGEAPLDVAVRLWNSDRRGQAAK